MGWHDHPAPPTINDLLPENIKWRFLDIWLSTGTNVLLSKAITILADFEDGAEAHRVVLESLESDVMLRVDDLAQKWRDEESALMERGAA